MSKTVIAAAGGDIAKIRFHYGTDDLFNSLSLRTSYRAKMIKDSGGNSQLDDIAISQDELDITKELLKSGTAKIGLKMFKIAQGVTDSIFYNDVLTNEDAVATVTGTPIAGGTGYVEGDVLTLVDILGTAIGATVTVIGETGGVIDTVSLTTKGSGYVVETANTTGGTGTGATIAIATIADNNLLSVASYGFHIVDNSAYNTNVLPALDEEIKNCLREYCLKEWYSIVGASDDLAIHLNLFNISMMEMSNLTFQLRKPTMA